MEEGKERPLFIKVENYREVLELVRMMKKKIAEAKMNLEKIYNLKGQEDAKIGEWEKIIKELDKRMDFVDASLFEPKE